MRSSRTVLTAVTCLVLGVSALASAPAVAATPATTPSLRMFSALTPLGDDVFFAATDDEHGRALWKSDGTPEGTVLVKVLNPTDTVTPGNGAPYGDTYGQFAAAGRRLFFSIDDGTHGIEPWVSDGTTAGTHLVRDVHPGPTGSEITELEGRGSTLFFTLAGARATRLWKSDGTRAGTVRVRSLDAAPVDPSGLYTWHRNVFFVAGKTGAGVGPALWKSDGSARGTRMVKDIRTGSPYLNPRIGHFAGGHTRLYFTANDGATMGDDNTGIWRTDGTRTGTRYVRNIDPGRSAWDAPRPEPEQLTTLGDRLLFTDTDCTHGQEPWSSDGTFDGTVLLDLDPRPAPSPESCGSSSYPQALITFHDAFHLAARVEGRNILFRSDGTPAGTTPVADLPPSQYASSYFVQDAVAGDRLFLGIHNPGNLGEPLVSTLWVSDGTATGTGEVHDFAAAGQTIGSLTRSGATLFFLVGSPDGSTALWTSDGTSAGTAPVLGG